VSRPLRIGLTGSIGMGKSTTAAMFRDLGVPVWDAAAAGRRLYRPGGAPVGPLGRLCREAIVDGAVDRAALKRWIAGDSRALGRIEAVVHPLVAADRERFAAEAADDLVVFDIPLLFETGGEAGMDLIVVVSAPPEIQRARVLERGTMGAAEFEAILAKQVPDAEKRARADVVVPTVAMEETRARIEELVRKLRDRDA